VRRERRAKQGLLERRVPLVTREKTVLKVILGKPVMMDLRVLRDKLEGKEMKALKVIKEILETGVIKVTKVTRVKQQWEAEEKLVTKE